MDADSDGQITEYEFSHYAAPVTVSSGGKVYQISVNPNGTTQVQEVVPDEPEAAEETPAEELAPTPGTVEDPADRESREILNTLIASLQAARANLRRKIQESIEKSEDEARTEEERAVERRAAEKLQEADDRLAAMEARIAAMPGLSPQQRAAILDQLKVLRTEVQNLETLTAGLEDGTYTTEEVRAQIGVVEEQVTVIDDQLDRVENELLTGVFGENVSRYVIDPQHALDDGVITADELTDDGKAVLARYLADIAAGGIEFGELQTLRDGGVSFATDRARREFAQMQGLEASTDNNSERAFNLLMEAAQAGKLDCDRWNEIMDECGFGKTYHMTDEAFEACFFGEKGGDEVSGTMVLMRGLHRTYTHMLTLCDASNPNYATSQISQTFRAYIKKEDFVFIDFQRQGEAMRFMLVQAYRDDTNIADANPTDEQLRDWLLATAYVKGDLKEILLALYGPSEYTTEQLENILKNDPQNQRVRDLLSFRHLSPEQQLEALTPYMLYRVFEGIQIDGEDMTDAEIGQEHLRTYERVLTAVQDEADGGEINDGAVEGSGVLLAYTNEAYTLLITGSRNNIDYQAVLDGNPNPIAYEEDGQAVHVPGGQPTPEVAEGEEAEETPPETEEPAQPPATTTEAPPPAEPDVAPTPASVVSEEA
jgi:vacuolar-type H+-ATPase subunit E/Vma4